ncbi:hypothetical protein BSKO_04151 [Bryopsis sp. KO-2023]|nr:hypothetical protein BSKO_04151 [Bryopsis sp. KO-2023]
MAPKKKLNDSETLAEASQSAVDKFLGQRGDKAKRREEQRRQQLLRKAAEAAGYALPETSRQDVSVCGARAKEHVDEDDDDLGESEDDEIEWEEDEGDENGSPFGGENLEIVFEEGDEKAKGRPRAGVTKAERDFSQLVHRVHVQCLLARGLLLDRAANDQVLQAHALSLAPNVDTPPSADDEASTLDLIKKIIPWFKAGFQSVPFDSNDCPTGHLVSPLAAVIDRLNGVLEKGKGEAGELCAVFAALLRAMGIIVRIVSVFDAVSLRPRGGVVRKRVRHPTENKTKGKKATSSAKSSKKKGKGKVKEEATVADDLDQGQANEEENQQAGPSKKRSGPDSSDAPQETPNPRKKRKGDEEFERQLAMAMEATAMASSPAKDHPGQPEEPPAPSILRVESGNAGSGWSRSKSLCHHWCEVFCGSVENGRWVHVDPINDWVDRCNAVEDIAHRRSPLTYVVGFSGGGAKDVTRRYANDFLQSRKHRDEQWWEETIHPFRGEDTVAKAALKSGRKKLSTSELQLAREDAELSARATAQQKLVPRTIEEFKKHPVYVLQRHIKKYQSLVPDAVRAGLHRGEGYYLREDLSDVHAPYVWRRLGRVVREEEIKNPCKSVKKRGASSREIDDEVVGDENSSRANIALYGVWQTDDWERPIAENGVVPKNDYGNVEAPPLAFDVPFGTVHLRFPHLVKICKRLNVDYAPALVGFEKARGMMVPKTEGVVVCEEHQGAVMEQYFVEERRRHELAVEKREKLAKAGWRNLLGAVWMRLKLDKSYGEVNNTGTNPDTGKEETTEGEKNLDVEIEEF